MAFAYIGSKKTLLPFIEECISKHICLENKTFADLFAGTGIVGSYFKNKYNCKIISNDMERYSWFMNEALLNSSYTDNVKDIIKKLNERSYNIDYKKLITETYCAYNGNERNFFSTENGLFIDYCRNVIDNLDLDKQEYIFLIASLLISLNKVANTTGVYGAYLKHIKKSAEKRLVIEPIHTNINKNDNTIYNTDTCNLKVKSDIVYLDPPYNTRQYSSNYFLLNYIVEYNKDIKIKGKTGIIENWNRSSFCSKSTIKQSLIDVLNNIDTTILAFSYNNEGLLSLGELINIFKSKFDKVAVYEKEYNKYKSQKNNTKESVVEYIFICE